MLGPSSTHPISATQHGADHAVLPKRTAAPATPQRRLVVGIAISVIFTTFGFWREQRRNLNHFLVVLSFARIQTPGALKREEQRDSGVLEKAAG